jgi:hypothetical protein
MPQEAIERVNQLRTADRQPKLLTSCDRKGLLIGETENPGVPDIVDTTVPDAEDRAEDLNFPAVNTDCGIGEPRDEDLPTVKTVKEDEDPVEQPLRIATNKSNQINDSLRNKFILKCLIQERLRLVARNALKPSLGDSFLLLPAPRLMKALPP